MQPLTMYQADDGSMHRDAAAAIARDEQLADVARALAPLGDRPESESCKYENGHGYFQHDRAAVLATRRALLTLTREPLADWFANQEAKFGKHYPDDFLTTHPSWFGRMLDGSAPPLEAAWRRLVCIDEQGREWGQPFFASNPHKAADGRRVDRQGNLVSGGDRDGTG